MMNMIKGLITKRINYKYLESSDIEDIATKLKTKLSTLTEIRIGNNSKPIYIRDKRIIKKELRKIKNILKLRYKNGS